MISGKKMARHITKNYTINEITFAAFIYMLHHKNRIKDSRKNVTESWPYNMCYNISYNPITKSVLCLALKSSYQKSSISERY